MRRELGAVFTIQAGFTPSSLKLTQKIRKMKKEDKLWNEYLEEIEKKNSNRVVSVISVLRFFHTEKIPFYKSLILWGYKRGQKGGKSK